MMLEVSRGVCVCVCVCVCENIAVLMAKGLLIYDIYL